MRQISINKRIGMRSIFLMLAALLLLSGSMHLKATCAQVKIEIVQELTLERQAFEAHMRINNGTDMLLAINEINVLFSDKDGNPVLATSDPNNLDAAFFIKVDEASMKNVNNYKINGFKITAGQVNGTVSADIYWLIIPAANSARGEAQGKLYYVGANLKYTLGGDQEFAVDVTPDYIFVKPLPNLALDYFIPRHVHGDDPQTAPIEPVIPFSLGLRVKNIGTGIAKKLKVESAQPKIVENVNGLLINFFIEGSEVNGQPASKSLLADFGDISPNSAKVARWIMTTTLSGQFVDMDVTVSHSDELGGHLTSLIKEENATIHELTREVLVDLPGRDKIIDFLALKNLGNVYWVFESDSTETQVTDQSLSSSLTYVATVGNDQKYQLTVPPTSGFVYVKLSNPENTSMKLKEVIRSDGKGILPANAWLSFQGLGSATEYFFNLFDVNATATYTVFFENIGAQPQPPVLQYINDKQRVEGVQLSFLVEASDANGTIPMVMAAPLPAGASFTDNGNGSGYFDWTAQIGQAGVYQVIVKASDGLLEDLQGVKITICSLADQDCDGMPDAWEEEQFGSADASDGTGDYDGDGISDLDEYLNGLNPKVTDNAPSPPEIVSPEIGGTITVLCPELIIKNSIDQEGDAVYYDFEIFGDSSFLIPVAQEYNFPESVKQTVWTVPVNLTENTHYYWRVRSTDNIGYSIWVYGDFFVNTVNENPAAFFVSSPLKGSAVANTKPILAVTNSSDADEDPLTYVFEVHADANFSTLIAKSLPIPAGLHGVTQWQVTVPLTDQTNYFWKATACDPSGLTAISELGSFFVDLTNQPPAIPKIHSPAINSEITAGAVELIILNSADPEGDPISYFFELDQVNTFDGANKKISGQVFFELEKTTWKVADLVDNTLYYWRVRAWDGNCASEFAYGEFFVNSGNDYPMTPSIKNPGINSWVKANNLQLQVFPPNDIDQDTLFYIFELYRDVALTDRAATERLSVPVWSVPTELLDGLRYYWRVCTQDEHGLRSPWLAVMTFFVRPGWNNTMPQFQWLQPAEEVLTGANELTLSWSDDDADSNALISLYYDTNMAGNDGQLIISGLKEDDDGAADAYSWDIKNSEGVFYVYAVITDQTSTLTLYNPKKITIDHTAPLLTASPAGGTYNSPRDIRLTANEAAIVYYTVDGSEPDTSATLYIDPIHISESTTLKFIGVDQAGNQSTVFTEVYQIQLIDQVTVHMASNKGRDILGITLYTYLSSGMPLRTAPSVTDSNGEANFNYTIFQDNESYKFKGTYLGIAFWSDDMVFPGDQHASIFFAEESVKITVVTGNTPCPGVTVDLYNGAGDTFLGVSKFTNASGEVIFDLPVGQQFKFLAHILNDSFWSEAFAVQGGAANETVLNAGGGIYHITVLKSVSGKNRLNPEQKQRETNGLAKVPVYLFDENNVYLNQMKQTNDYGQAGFAVPRGNYKVRVDYLGYSFWNTAMLVEADTAVDFSIVHTAKPITVNQVFNGISHPVANIDVNLMKAEGLTFVTARKTDENGMVAYELPDQFNYEVRADYLGMQKWGRLFFVNQLVLDIPMAEAVITVKQGEKRLPGLVVDACLPDGTFSGLAHTTNETGQAVFLLPAATYQFKTRYQGHDFWSVKETLPVDQSIALDISTGGGSFTLKIQKSDTEFIAGAACFIFDEQGNYLNLKAVSDINGNVSFDLADGQYKIRCDYLGYSFESELFSVPACNAKTITIPHTNVSLTVYGMFLGVEQPLSGASAVLLTAGAQESGLAGVTDSNGSIVFSVPAKDFKYQITYLGNSYETDVFQSMDKTLIINLAKGEIMVTFAGNLLESVDVSLLSAAGIPLGITQTTDSTGKASFLLPVGQYKFACQRGAAEFFSALESFAADQIKQIEISTGGTNFTFTVFKNAAEPLADVVCYLFDESGSYLGQQGSTNSNGLVGFTTASGKIKIRADYLGYQYWSDVYSIPAVLSGTVSIQFSPVKMTIQSHYPVNGEALAEIPVQLFTADGTNVNKNGVTDDLGQIIFSLPNKPYKVKASYIGRYFWSEIFQALDQILEISRGKVGITVKQSGTAMADKQVELFTPDNFALNLSTATNVSGKAEFVLPLGSFRFRVIQAGKEYWTSVITVLPAAAVAVELTVE